MTHRAVTLGVVMSGVAVLLAACGGSSVSGPSKGPTSIGKGEGALNIIVWAGYAEYGATDPTVNWVTPFQQQTGCKTNPKIAGTSDEMVSLMQTGQYDGVSASGNATLRLMVGGNVAPVNVDLIDNYKDINPALKDQPYNTYQGTHYGIPHGWGANLLMWRTDLVNPAPTSWGAVFDPNSPYKGKVTAYDDPIYIADAALYLKKTQPSLGITDVYELTQPQFTAAVNLLKQQRTVIGQYWSDYTKTQAAFANGDTLIGTTWQVITNLLLSNKPPTPVQAIVPSEGSTGWSDTWMVSSQAAHPNCMYMWMNYITSPKVQSQVAQWFGEAPANPKACAIISQTDSNFCTTYHVNDTQFLSSLALWKVPLKNCGDSRGNVCMSYQDWLTAWTDIKG
ncbi:MAG TPA: ABC transporter substrate-binding protein [Candidatus Acidoferrales bacterium]|jgi:putative spermidine/putrescine transport system substrate-binding protein|nr:ABC transporter substrate-binding protein [Candidatus Acidoferrales bacterium]